MFKALAAIFHVLTHLRIWRGYRPERHYMRGSGPKQGAA